MLCCRSKIIKEKCARLPYLSLRSVCEAVGVVPDQEQGGYHIRAIISAALTAVWTITAVLLNCQRKVDSKWFFLRINESCARPQFKGACPTAIQVVPEASQGTKGSKVLSNSCVKSAMEHPSLIPVHRYQCPANPTRQFAFAHPANGTGRWRARQGPTINKTDTSAASEGVTTKAHKPGIEGQPKKWTAATRNTPLRQHSLWAPPRSRGLAGTFSGT